MTQIEMFGQEAVIGFVFKCHSEQKFSDYQFF